MENRTYNIEIDPRILELLGPNLYTNIYIMLAELIANAYPKSSVGTPLHFDVINIDFILIDKPHVKALQNFIMNVLSHVGGSDNSINTDERWTLLSKILVYENLINNL